MSGIFDNYLDLDCVPGCDFDFDFQVTPLSLSALSCWLIIDGIPGSPWAVTTTNINVGVNPYLVFDLDIPGTTTIGWLPGPYTYRVVVTFSDGSVEELVNGIVLVTEKNVTTNGVPVITTSQTLFAGSCELFDTSGGALALVAPNPSLDGTRFLTGDAGGVVDTNNCVLTDANGFKFENPIDGQLYGAIVWGPGNGGTSVPPNGPNLTRFMADTWQRVTTVGNGTYWKNVT